MTLGLVRHVFRSDRYVYSRCRVIHGLRQDASSGESMRGGRVSNIRNHHSCIFTRVEEDGVALEQSKACGWRASEQW
jgi:hypothetical protein